MRITNDMISFQTTSICLSSKIIHIDYEKFNYWSNYDYYICGCFLWCHEFIVGILKKLF
jgi:hypothetical protein